MQVCEIVEAKWLKEYEVELVFNNRRKACVDLKKYLGVGVFKNLIDLRQFKKFKIDAELGTIVWPNGADIAPEVLYQDAFERQKSDTLSKAA